MKYVNCLICGSNDYKIIYRNKNDKFLKFIESDKRLSQKVICRNCGLIFQNPLFTDEELERIYSLECGMQASYGSPHPTEKFLKDKKVRASIQIKWIESNMDLNGNKLCNGRWGPKKALEVGCSAGLLLAELKRRGWEVEGIEPAKNFADYARDNFDIKVYLQPFEHVKLQDARYELIIISHLLEHLSDPISCLYKLSHYLNPKGYLFIEIPNIRGIWRNLDNQFQSTHIFIPSTVTMRLIIDKAKLAIYKEECQGRVIRYLLRLPGKDVKKVELKKKDDYRLLGLRLKFQALISHLFKYMPSLFRLKQSLQKT
jgi:2-polyprenyl-3-methyl-5-hydroxy-6-metoxy-1,4-benzoquinol methylase